MHKRSNRPQVVVSLRFALKACLYGQVTRQAYLFMTIESTQNVDSIVFACRPYLCRQAVQLKMLQKGSSPET